MHSSWAIDAIFNAKYETNLPRVGAPNALCSLRLENAGEEWELVSPLPKGEGLLGGDSDRYGNLGWPALPNGHEKHGETHRSARSTSMVSERIYLDLHSS